MPAGATIAPVSDDMMGVLRMPSGDKMGAREERVHDPEKQAARAEIAMDPARRVLSVRQPLLGMRLKAWRWYVITVAALRDLDVPDGFEAKVDVDVARATFPPTRTEWIEVLTVFAALTKSHGAAQTWEDAVMEVGNALVGGRFKAADEFKDCVKLMRRQHRREHGLMTSRAPAEVDMATLNAQQRSRLAEAPRSATARTMGLGMALATVLGTRVKSVVGMRSCKMTMRLEPVVAANGEHVMVPCGVLALDRGHNKTPSKTATPSGDRHVAVSHAGKTLGEYMAQRIHCPFFWASLVFAGMTPEERGDTGSVYLLCGSVADGSTPLGMVPLSSRAFGDMFKRHSGVACTVYRKRLVTDALTSTIAVDPTVQPEGVIRTAAHSAGWLTTSDPSSQRVVRDHYVTAAFEVVHDVVGNAAVGASPPPREARRLDSVLDANVADVEAPMKAVLEATRVRGEQQSTATKAAVSALWALISAARVAFREAELDRDQHDLGTRLEALSGDGRGKLAREVRASLAQVSPAREEAAVRAAKACAEAIDEVELRVKEDKVVAARREAGSGDAAAAPPK